MKFKTKISQMHYDKGAKGLVFNFFKSLSYYYGLASKAKNYLYDKKILQPKKVDAYVISVGNMTTGGVGKTPVVAEIANYFTNKGEKVAIVSRGYGGKLSGVNVISDGKTLYFAADIAGDEPRWLSENTNAYVITSKSRYKGAKYAIEKYGVTKIILDDGFQHRKLYRDLDIVLVDSEKGFGNENLLPAGPLREGFEAFDRIDKLVVVSKNTDHSRADKYAKVMGRKLKKDTVVCCLEPAGVNNIFHTKEQLEDGENVLAFSAIGQPQQFYKFLHNYNVIKTIDFDDHHNYTQGDIDELQQICKDLDINSLITTEKDAAKIVDLGCYMKVFALKLKTNLDIEKLLNVSIENKNGN